MNILEFNTPAPSCLIPPCHPSYSYVPSNRTDIKRTWNEHSTYELGDDYDRVNADDWLDRGFKQ